MSEINQIIRILEGKRLKYTITIVTKQGQRFEIQSDVPAKPDWDNESRMLMLSCQQSDYAQHRIMPFDNVALIFNEPNEGATQSTS